MKTIFIELWKPIKGYENLYAISNIGRVKSLSRYRIDRGFSKSIKEKILKQGKSSNGYFHVDLYKGSKGTICSIHRLVAEAFIDNKKKRPQINHINGIKTDNKIENLEWVNASENRIHAFKNNLQKKAFKKVIQLDKNGGILKIWNSCKEAYKALGAKQGTFASSLANGFKCKGYNFKLLK